MLRRFSLLLMLLPLSLPASAADEASAWAPAAVSNGVPYQSLDEVRSFYKLSTGVKSARKGALSIGNADMSLEFGPGLRELHISGIAVQLAYPLCRDAAGNLLISRQDWVKWIDPILRPTYIADRSSIRTVVLDPGHGGHDAGLAFPYVKEADSTLQIALKLQEELERMGYKVILTRTGDYFLSDQQRVDIANAAEQAVFVSLHMNGGHADARGTEVYVTTPAEAAAKPRPGNAEDSRNAALAYALEASLAASSGTRDGGCRHAHYTLLSSIACPAAWVELGYATHAQEGPQLAAPAYQARLAQALAQGIATYAKASDPAAHIPVQQPPPKAAPKPAPTPERSKTKATETKSRSATSSPKTSSSRQQQRSGSSRTRTRSRSR